MATKTPRLPLDLRRKIKRLQQLWDRTWEQQAHADQLLAELGVEFDDVFWRWRKHVGYRSERDFVYECLVGGALPIWREFVSSPTYLKIQRARRARRRRAAP